jgi:hypothetical protein
VVRCGLDSAGSGYGSISGFCELENDNSDSTQGEEILYELNDYMPFEEDPEKLS